MLKCGRYTFDLQERPLVMGILNVTPDSFSDGGRFFSSKDALKRAEQMIKEGVDILDIGAESTRPGTEALPLEDELERILPVVKALRDCGKPLSIDTYKPEVMKATLAEGVDLINDISGFTNPKSIEVVSKENCALCVMHMQGNPKTMQDTPAYNDVVFEVIQFLKKSVKELENANVHSNRICIDPGFGFGKTLSHNVDLLKNIHRLEKEVGFPVLVGLSRKSMIGMITGREVGERLAGSLAGVLRATMNGAKILRVHDVKETVDALKVWQATQ